MSVSTFSPATLLLGRRLLAMTLVAWFGGSCCSSEALCQNSVEIRRVDRAKRPVFSSEEKELFFSDIADALVGERPTAELVDNRDRNGEQSAPKEKAGAWSNLIGRAVLEDEVKFQRQKLATLLTTPVIFQTKFGDINQSFEMLSVVFALIRQYDGDVRWKKQAAEAQVLFQQAAEASRTGAVAGFRLCKTRAEDLEQLVRGGGITSRESVSDTIDWSRAAHRSPLMVRLGTANDRLKRMTATEEAFKSSTQELNHEASIVAALAKVILAEEMPDADDDGYVELAGAMERAAVEATQAVRLEDYANAAAATNKISQSCNHCHQEWR